MADLRIAAQAVLSGDVGFQFGLSGFAYLLHFRPRIEIELGHNLIRHNLGTLHRHAVSNGAHVFGVKREIDYLDQLLARRAKPPRESTETVTHAGVGLMTDTSAIRPSALRPWN